eukprot:140453-Karenia_brevis.AAC.1
MGPQLGTVNHEIPSPKVFTTRMKKNTMTTVTTETKELETLLPVRRKTIALWQDCKGTRQHMQLARRPSLR